MIKSCASNCSSRSQDLLHGTGQRVHNEGLKGEASCTVCGLGDKRLAKKKATGL